MEPIILLDIRDKTGDFAAQLVPIFGLAVVKQEHHDNRNNPDVPKENWEDVTQVTWDLRAAIAGGKWAVIGSHASETETKKAHDTIVQEIVNGKKVVRFTILHEAADTEPDEPMPSIIKEGGEEGGSEPDHNNEKD